MIEHARIPSPVGDLGVSVEDDTLVEVRFDPDEAATAADPGGFAGALRAYFDGDLAALDGLRVAPRGTEFQERVWRALRGIAVGETVSYSEVARAAGRPDAVRAAASAVGKNPIGIVIPCHRVVRADGSIGGYAGGLDRKRWLLAHEGARLA